MEGPCPGEHRRARAQAGPWWGTEPGTKASGHLTEMRVITGRQV